MKTTIENKEYEYKMRKTFTCSFCKVAGHRIDYCKSEEKEDFINGNILMIESIDTEEQLIEYLSSLSNSKLKILSLIYNLPCQLNKNQVIENLTSIYIDIQFSGKIKSNKQIDELKRQHPNMELTDIIEIEIISRLINHFGYESFNTEYVSSINWIDSIYLRQPLDIRRQIINGFTSAIAYLRDRIDEEIIGDPDPNPSQDDMWYIEPSMICIDTIDELNKKKECNICYEEYENFHFSKTNCNHEFCNSCIHKHLNNHLNKKTPCCPLCRNEIQKLEIKDVQRFNDFKLCFSKI